MKNIITIVIIAAAAVAGIFLPRGDFRDFRFGLDLRGGTHLVYEADTSSLADSDVETAISATRQNLEQRTNLLGVSEAIVQTAKSGDTYRLIVELPGVSDVDTALATIGQTAQLEFAQVEEVPNPDPKATPSAILVPTDLTGRDLKSASVQFGGGDQVSGSPSVSIEFTPEGTKKFAAITAKNVGKPLPILLDGQVITAPTVQAVITDSQAVISGDFTLEDAKRLSIQLNAGALPVPIKVIEQRTIGATLGEASITKSLQAGLIGLVAIFIFMIINYRLKGLLACVALFIYILISLSIFKLVPVTLTLAGIAGFILSIGMAVDANILIFERIKEELSWGRSLLTAIELGFKRAWTSVRDSNASSLITAGILFWFGTGAVRGFALTLIIGILVSLFTSITVTRTLLRIVYERN
ncbi:MAG: protein translocase subunit SecD [Patescibacteria group bacterium]